ncbi:ATP-binding protein [Tepidimicrobium xylanilyticum]|nr:ATP-binding protein [Tepidimicrobium xylanilyticum]GMG96231.1 hypothetical protein EN5CB1_10570 [Tepidimicrobium xylanilyticum]
MDQLQKIAERILNSIKANSSGTEEKTHYECEICKDEEWLFDIENNTARPCKCREVKLYKRIIESSGITEAFLQRNFNNFKPTNKITADAKAMAMDYVKKFDSIKNLRNNSIAFLGQVGAGKTHLSIAIANEFMKRNIGVRYMQYREDITRIKQVAMDEESYAKEINKYKNATVLLIDDLYKNATHRTRAGYEVLNDADKRAIFEIVNYRYFKNAPMIISSEYLINDIIDFDEGIGTRITEMCKGHIIEFQGQELNYRLHKAL